MDTFIKYYVTGLDRDNRRFKKVYTGPRWAFGINLYSGSVWGILPDGKRKLLKRVWN